MIISVPPCERSLGSKVACSDMELMKVVTRGVPPTRTTEPCVKPVPVTFNVSALLPAETEPPTGSGLLTVNVNATEVKPSGFVTITNGFPAIAIALAGIEAVSWVELTNVVDTLFRWKLICEPCTKPLPFTVRENAGPPAVALVGEMFETANGAAGGKIVSVTVLEVPPPGTPFDGLVTVILIVPWVAI